MIASLHEGTFSVGRDEKFVPIDPGDQPERGALKLALNPFLIHNDNLTALIDAGPGPFGPLDHYELLNRNLEEHGLAPDDIQQVFLSHLHMDHIGGLLHEQFGAFALTFPNAEIWLSGEDWRRFVANAEEKGHDATSRWALFLETHAELRFADEESPGTDQIEMKTIGGHTRYHQGIFYDGPEGKAMMLGDVLGRPEAVNRKFSAKFDFDGAKSQEMRNKYLQMALQEEYFILTYHGGNGAILRLTGYDSKKGYDIQHITSGRLGNAS
ncbi:MBL fold metallo-hydrolase [Natronogracilivirga saccharolytica]|uniref:MBL fold metallo-hydrolase n=1 Tax=Natronogracilivirga saccharolytica TaxID=2812953 RepID=A0A8J7RP50_9BACT|nr:MBL fold metallo-hydrolase [Natronogracilivirga saccharolytica]MBP3193608.1 MBL fold metallo-hydrolase [Natronogracilivirga saccharolytica]